MAALRSEAADHRQRDQQEERVAARKHRAADHRVLPRRQVAQRLTQAYRSCGRLGQLGRPRRVARHSQARRPAATAAAAAAARPRPATPRPRARPAHAATAWRLGRPRLPERPPLLAPPPPRAPPQMARRPRRCPAPHHREAVAAAARHEGDTRSPPWRGGHASRTVARIPRRFSIARSRAGNRRHKTAQPYKSTAPAFLCSAARLAARGMLTLIGVASSLVAPVPSRRRLLSSFLVAPTLWDHMAAVADDDSIRFEADDLSFSFALPPGGPGPRRMSHARLTPLRANAQAGWA